MFARKTPEAAEKKLVLGDYVTVHMSGLKTAQVYNAKPGDLQVHREAFFQRIRNQRGESFKRIEKPGGDLIDVRLRVVA